MTAHHLRPALHRALQAPRCAAVDLAWRSIDALAHVVRVGTQMLWQARILVLLLPILPIVASRRHLWRCVQNSLSLHVLQTLPLQLCCLLLDLLLLCDQLQPHEFLLLFLEPDGLALGPDDLLFLRETSLTTVTAELCIRHEFVVAIRAVSVYGSTQCRLLPCLRLQNL